MITKYGTYMWLFLTQMFHNGKKQNKNKKQTNKKKTNKKTGHGGDRKTFEVMTSTYPPGTFSSVASLKCSEWEN